MNLSALPRAALTRLPTPLDEAPRLAAAIGLQRLLIKRDDLTDLALGGNKVRKLEFLLGEAQARGADTVITTAGWQSNFLRLTAAAARHEGMTPILVVRGNPDAPSRGNLLLMRVFGADLRFVDTDDPFATTTSVAMQSIADEVRARGARPYVMNIATFSGGLATVGYVAGALELAQQLRDKGVEARHLVLAVGSGGTYAGLLLGFRLAGIPTRVWGVSVNIAAPRLREMIAHHMREAARLLNVTSPVRHEEVDITDAHVGPGYGMPTPESLDAIRVAATTEGLVFDPIYTGKAWAALAHAVQQGRISPASTVVFLHTGGVPNLFLHAERVAPTALRTPTV